MGRKEMLNHDIAVRAFKTDKRSSRRIPISERFWAKVRRTNSCWNWVGAKTGNGYGSIQDDAPSRKQILAHRYSYFEKYGYYPKEIDHTCFNKTCVNPEHLEDVTHDQNMKRADKHYGLRSEKTHCPRGHEYNAENTRISNGRRNCRECFRTYYQRNRRLNYAS